MATDKKKSGRAAFVVTVLYIALTVLSPAELFPELAPYRIMVWLALLAVAISASAALHKKWLNLPHFCLMLGIIASIGLSRLLNGWVGGVGPALINFLPVGIVFFLILWNVNSVDRLRRLSTVLIVIGIYYTAQGAV